MLHNTSLEENLCTQTKMFPFFLTRSIFPYLKFCINNKGKLTIFKYVLCPRLYSIRVTKIMRNRYNHCHLKDGEAEALEDTSPGVEELESQPDRSHFKVFFFPSLPVS